MTDLLNFLAQLVGAVLRVGVWLLTAALAVFLLGLAVLLLLLGALWAVVRGQKPGTPVWVGRMRRYSEARIWPAAGGGHAGSGTSAEVVDVEVREVTPTEDSTRQRLPGQPPQ